MTNIHRTSDDGDRHTSPRGVVRGRGAIVLPLDRGALAARGQARADPGSESLGCGWSDGGRNCGANPSGSP
ncbi:hypothetical protein COCNU_scaffold071262G000010 [Cocos nucifera]|nr:hypothetical protein [Cocos nucifera]